MLQLRRIIWLGSFLCILILVSVGLAKTLEEELYEIDKLRLGKKTPFDKAEKMANELLRKYTQPEEQGKICYQLAEVYAQSGQVWPAKTAEFSEKALGYPLDPVKQLQLYVYWGDAIQVAHRGVRNQELVVARRKAVMPYLEGLKEALDHNLPEEKPELPGVGRFRYSGPQDSEQYRELIRKHQAQVEARKLAKFQRDMIQHRDALTGQISYMYSRFPFASEEIEKLATEVLQDENAVERLMSAVNAAVQKRIEQLGWGPEPPDMSLPPKKEPPVAAEAPEEIFIPASRAALEQGEPFVLDLASEQLLNPTVQAGSAQAYKKLLELGRGDIAWDGGLVTLRKAKALTVAQESCQPLECTPERWCNRDKLPEDVKLPYTLLVVTNEDTDYLIRVLKIEAAGITITCRKLNSEQLRNYLSEANE